MTAITIDLDEILGHEDQPSLRTAVLTKAALLLTERLHAEAADHIKQTIAQVVDDEIREIVRTALAAPIQRTSPWGEKCGEPASVLDLARESLEKFVAAPAHRRDEFGGARRGPASNLTELIEDVVASAMRAELQPAVKEARAQISARMKEHLTTALAADVSKIAR